MLRLTTETGIYRGELVGVKLANGEHDRLGGGTLAAYLGFLLLSADLRAEWPF